MTLTRRAVILSGLSLTAIAGRAMAANPVFYRTPGCGCCHTWTERMAAAGLPVGLEDTGDLAGLSAKLGVPEQHQGCHVGEIGGYVVSGHVPPQDIKRLLAEKPQARGLAVPGMPMGSPGMDMGSRSERYEVLLLKADGTAEVYAVHGEA